jgi:RNase adaptor protein for sRNA GlmZ degradation
MDKLRFSVIAKVEVSKERVLSKVVSDLIAFFLERLLVQMVSHANSSADNEVHLENFFFFIIDNVLVLLLTEVTGFQSKGNVVEELAIFILLRVEEETEVVEYVIEEIVHNDTTLNAARE